MFWILGMLALLLVIWLSNPKLTHPELIKRACLNAEERHSERQQFAADPSLNLYLSPTFLPLWGVPDARQEDCATERTVKAWIKYSSWGTDLDHNRLRSDPDYLQAKADFEVLAETLFRELDKPVFVVPTERLFLYEEFLDPAGLIGVSSALDVLAEAEVTRGRLGVALEILVRNLEFAQKIQYQGNFTSIIIGEALQVRTTTALVGLIPVEAPVEWGRLAEVCLASPPQKEGLTHYLEDKILAAGSVFNTPAPARYMGKDMKPGCAFSAILLRPFAPRWLRRYQNAMAPVLLAAMRGGPLVAPPPKASSRPLRAIDQQHLNILSRVFYLRGLQLLNVGVAAWLLAQRQQLGAFPETLSELNIDCSGMVWDSQKAELFIPADLRVQGKDWHESTTNPFSETPWCITLSNGWLYKLKSVQ